MKKYYTVEAKQSKINQISKLIDVIMSTSGDVINYIDAKAIVEILADYKNDLEKEAEN